MARRFLAISLALCIVFGLLPETILAAGIDSGTCGDNLTWVLDENGTLTISGAGDLWGTNWTDYNADVKTVVIEQGVIEIGSGAFKGCINLTSITIPNSATLIGSGAFDGCKNLDSITIPNSVTHIASMAFQDCTNLTEIILSNSLTTIGRDAFKNCTSLTNIILPDSLTTIGGWAFDGCTSLTSITIPDSVSSMGDSVLNGCTSLTDIILSNSLTTIGSWAFDGCTSLTNITIPNSVSTIGSWAFNGCTSLTNIIIPNSVSTIEDSAFLHCTGLSNITVPHSVTTMEDWAFGGCSNLSNITISGPIPRIGDHTFEICTNLTSITIPNSVSTIGDSAFYFCRNLTDVYYGGSKDQWDQISIGKQNECLTSATIHYNQESGGDTPVPKAHLVTYLLNGGTWDEMIGETWETGKTVDIPKTVPAKDDYTFGGWSDGTTSYQPGDTFTMPDHDVTLTAVWRAEFDYSVTYLLNGGTADVPATGYLAGQTVTITNKVPTKEGYVFDGWSDGSTIYQPGNTFEMPTHDVTLTAIWKEAPVLSDHSVTYRLNGGTGSVPANGYLSGQTVTVITNIPTKEGYTFGGWSDGTTTYRPGDTFTMPDHDVTLTAVWKDFIGPPVPTFTVTYSLDGGVGNLPAEQHKLNETVVISTVIPQKEGYVFLGWTDGSIEYRVNETFKMPNHDVVLVAIWTDAINEDVVFLKQPSNSSKCTLTTATMMVRRRAILDGIDNWESITIEAMEKVAWCHKGFIEAFTYRGMTGATDSTRGMNLEQKKDYLISMLQQHPEGIGIYKFTSYQRHAVLLTDYDKETDTFYCADPAGPSKGRIPLTQCTIKGDGEGQNGIINVIHRTYYIAKDTNRKTLVSTKINSHCPVDMVFLIDGKELDSRSINGVETNNLATMIVSGIDNSRNVEVQIHGDYVNYYDTDIKLIGTGIGKMALTVEHLFSDGSVEKNTFEAVPITHTFIGTASGFYPQSSVLLSISDTLTSDKQDIWVSNPGEIATEAYINFDNLESGDTPVTPSRPSNSGSNSSTPGTYYTSIRSSYTISVVDVTNGTVKVSPKSAYKGNTVTISAVPNSGYVLDTLTVTDQNGKDVKLTSKGTSKYTFIMPNSKVTVSASFRLASRVVGSVFSDVPAGYWAKGAIDWASANGYMKGLTESIFNPEGAATRQQVWMILARLSGQSPSGMAEARIWAMNSGLSDGTNPGAPVTRQQMVTFLHRYCGMRGHPVSGSGDLTAFRDYSSASDYAKNALAWAVGNGIVTGTKAGTLNPGGFATRAQFAVVLKRFYEDDFSD